jgi:hypothetical protein
MGRALLRKLQYRDTERAEKEAGITTLSGIVASDPRGFIRYHPSGLVSSVQKRLPSALFLPAHVILNVIEACFTKCSALTVITRLDAGGGLRYRHIDSERLLRRSVPDLPLSVGLLYASNSRRGSEISPHLSSECHRDILC